eukprot:g2328.t1
MSMASPSPADAGMDPNRLKAISDYMDGLVERKIIPCHVTLVARRGKIAYLHMGGTQNSGEKNSLTESATPIAADTLFRIYSMSKPITSVALMQLFEQGKFLLNHPIHLYLGEKWKKNNMRVYVSGHPKAGNVRTVPCDKSITMLQVLTHTSGLTYGFDAEGILNPLDAVYTRANLVGKGDTIMSF